jgi:hypothetical protein
MARYVAEAYWTYYQGMIGGVEVREDDPDVVVLSAHKTCHESRTHEGATPAVSGREDAKDIHTHIQGDVGTGRTDAKLCATDQVFCGCRPHTLGIPGRGRQRAFCHRPPGPKK